MPESDGINTGTDGSTDAAGHHAPTQTIMVQDQPQAAAQAAENVDITPVDNAIARPKTFLHYRVWGYLQLLQELPLVQF